MWVAHLGVMVFNYTASAPFIPSHCGFFFVFGHRISFLVGSGIFISGCLAVSCDFGVLLRGCELRVLLLCYLVPGYAIIFK